MSRTPFVPLLALSLVVTSTPITLAAQSGTTPGNDSFDLERFSDQQLDNLVGPIALYPDALLAQVLVAATFPDQVEDAARWVREHGTAGIDEQPWDVSVRSVSHYHSALNMMADKADWTATLGRAYAYQSGDVMAAVQRMRRLADQQGNLVSTPQQQVLREADSYVIVPARPRVIYVPVYDPVVIYQRPLFGAGFSSRFWSFGVGFPIGGWLNYDLDWGRRAVYYNGWDDVYFGYGGGWRARSRPFIQVTNVYVSPRYRNVFVNRNVVYRSVNYRNVDRYAGYHRDVYFASRRDGYRDGYRSGRSNGRSDGRDRGTWWGDQVGRTAQPRPQSAAATPDGYRNGLPQRDAVRGESRGESRAETRSGYRRDNSVSAARGDGNRADEGRAARLAPRNDAAARVMPSERRRETPASSMSVRAPASESRSPTVRSTPPRASSSTAGESRGGTTRTAKPRGSAGGNRGERDR